MGRLQVALALAFSVAVAFAVVNIFFASVRSSTSDMSSSLAGFSAQLKAANLALASHERSERRLSQQVEELKKVVADAVAAGSGTGRESGERAQNERESAEKNAGSGTPAPSSTAPRPNLGGARVRALAVDGEQSQREQILEQKLRDYAQIHADIMSGKRDPRYVECILINGWGNVLQEGVSCFLWALLSERAAIFNWQGVRHYMPFGPWLNGKTEEKPLRGQVPNHMKNVHMPFDGYNIGVLKKHQMYRVTRHDLQCLDPKNISAEYVQIHLTYDYYAGYILSNPLIGDAATEWMPENYFQIIFRYLWRLHPDLQAEVDAFKRRFFGKYTVGLQIRSANSVTKKGKVDHKGMPEPELDLFAQVMEQISRTQEAVPHTDVVWFVATQNRQYIQTLEDAYGSTKIVHFNATITTTFDPGDEGQKSALLTWWLLGDTDDVVTTELSSYGTTAAARGGIRAVVCNAHKFCHRRITATPCQDTKFPRDQPQKCAGAVKALPHHFMASPEQHCGYFKHQTYSDPKYIAAQRQK